MVCVTPDVIQDGEEITVMKCGHCRNNGFCFHINGTCLTGCSAGFTGEVCKIRTYEGTKAKHCQRQIVMLTHLMEGIKDANSFVKPKKIEYYWFPIYQGPVFRKMVNSNTC
uniref:EGF-like domain-containing protein n=1 Tax=Magallana gigas TaxID=29159 RepID=K1RXX9_MAGGI